MFIDLGVYLVIKELYIIFTALPTVQERKPLNNLGNSGERQ